MRLGRFLRDGQFVIAALPIAEVFFDESEGSFRVHIAGDDDRCVFGSIPPPEKLL